MDGVYCTGMITSLKLKTDEAVHNCSQTLKYRKKSYQQHHGARTSN